MATTTLTVQGTPEELKQLLDALNQKPRGDTKFGIVLFHSAKEDKLGEITVKDTETNLHATVTLLDSEGNETTADSPPVWESSDASVVAPTVAGDGLTATFDVGSPGSAVVTVTATETHEGEGDPTEIVFTGLVNVVAGDAVTGSVEFSTS